LGEKDELESRTTLIQEGEDDEDISSMDTTMPTAQQGPIAQACAQQLNYQVKSFLIAHTNPSQNEMLLNYGDECLILRSMGHEEKVRSCHNNPERPQASRLEMRGAPRKGCEPFRFESSGQQGNTKLFWHNSWFRRLFGAYEYSLESS
jgi:hypothetical protein